MEGVKAEACYDSNRKAALMELIVSLVWGHKSPGFDAYRPLLREWDGCLLMD